VAVVVEFQLPDQFLDQPGSRAGFVLLGMFLLSFLFIRTSARLMRSPRVTWWPGSVTTDSGLHLHHLVWGIALILMSGFLGFALNPVSPWNEILAAAFGVGAGFTLDEFALWIYLKDVYWAEEGRKSLDAVIVAAVLGGLVLLGLAPFNVKGNNSSLVSLGFAIGIDVALAAIVILKGKPLLGVVGLFFPLAFVPGMFRLASPTSLWARRFYKPGGRQWRRSQARWKRIAERRERFADLVAGAPTADLSARRGVGAAADAGTREGVGAAADAGAREGVGAAADAGARRPLPGPPDPPVDRG
jgi:hypothetical protein